MKVRFNFDTDYVGVQEEEIFEYPDDTPPLEIMDDLESWLEDHISYWAEVVDEDGEVLRDI